MKEKIWKFEQAFEFVKNKRQIIYPNFGFQKQLRQYEVYIGLITQEQFEQENEKRKQDLYSLMKY